MKVSMLLEFHVIINARITAEAVNNPKDIRTTTSASWHLSSQARVARCTIYHWTRSIEFLCFRCSCFNQVFPSLNFTKKDQDLIQADCSRKMRKDEDIMDHGEDEDTNVILAKKCWQFQLLWSLSIPLKIQKKK